MLFLLFSCLLPQTFSPRNPHSCRESPSLGFRVEGGGFWVEGFRVEGFGLRVEGSRVEGEG